MRVIIADDEIHMREAIEFMIDWENYGVTEVFYAQNGKEALQIIEDRKPELLLCDMEMPVMGGRELLHEIVERQIRIQVVAISGYSDFQYVHAALLANGVDYILKPFNRETLVNAIEKAIMRIQGEKEDAVKNRQHEQMGLAMAVQVLQNFCREENVASEQILSAFGKLGASKEERFLLVSVLNRNAGAIIEERYEGDKDLFFFTIGNVLRDVFKTYLFKQEIAIDDFNWQFFLQENEANPFRVTEKMKIFEKKIKNTIGLDITFVVSLEPVSLLDLGRTIHEQNGLLRQRNVWGCSMPASVIEPDTVQRNSVLTLELRIVSAMRQKDGDRLREIIEDYCLSLKSTDLRLQELQNCTADMNLLLHRIASQQEQDNKLEPLSLWINDIDLWEMETLKRLDTLMSSFRSKEEPADRIYSYIKEHYAENITLSTIAADFYQTPQYVARIFKAKYHKTVVNSIMEVRMEKACELLKAGEKSVAQVGEIVGYEDENYFGRVFKKYTGQSPAQYRRERSE